MHTCLNESATGVQPIPVFLFGKVTAVMRAFSYEAVTGTKGIWKLEVCTLSILTSHSPVMHERLKVHVTVELARNTAPPVAMGSRGRRRDCLLMMFNMMLEV